MKRIHYNSDHFIIVNGNRWGVEIRSFLGIKNSTLCTLDALNQTQMDVIKVNSSIISSDNNLNDLAYMKVLLLTLISILTFGRFAKVEGMKKRAHSKYREGYCLKNSQNSHAKEEASI